MTSNLKAELRKDRNRSQEERQADSWQDLRPRVNLTDYANKTSDELSFSQCKSVWDDYCLLSKVHTQATFLEFDEELRQAIESRLETFREVMSRWDSTALIDPQYQ